MTKKKEITEVSVIITEGTGNDRKLQRITKKKSDFPKKFQADFPGSVFEGPYEMETNREFYMYKKT